MTEQNKQWICRRCEFRENNHCICPAMYKNSGDLKPPTVYINCSQSFTECKYFSEGTEQNKGLLLTPEEQNPFIQVETHGYGDVDITGEIYDIDGLLKAQLSKAKPIIEKQERERIINKVEKQIWESYYITPDRKPIVIDGIRQALKGKLDG